MGMVFISNKIIMAIHNINQYSLSCGLAFSGAFHTLSAGHLLPKDGQRLLIWLLSLGCLIVSNLYTNRKWWCCVESQSDTTQNNESY